MQKQIYICSTCRFGVRNYTSVIGNIPWCCEKHWHCKPGSLASDYVPKPEAIMFLSRNRNSMERSIGGTPVRTVSMSGWKTATPRITRTTALLAVNLWERRTE